MSEPLRLLLVDDSTNDAALLTIQLERMGFDVTTERVQTPEAFDAALDREWDFVIADHSMPGFDSRRALELLKARNLDLPFVIWSGTIPAATAIALMKEGAHDFIAKDDVARLEPVLRRELGHAANREGLRRAELARDQLVVRLESALRAKDEFLAMLGHELRNPLAPIVTAAQILRQQRGGAPSAELDVVERQLRHLVRLVDDLLDVERVAHGKVELRRRPVELAVAVATGVELARPLIDQNKHHLSVEVAEHGLVVDADGARMAQVVSNLLNNAARYTPPGGSISLTAAVEGTEVVLRVVDSGIGIDATMLTTVFDIFVQGAKTTDRKTGGLGLGLAIVRNLMTLHGGTVSASSKGRDCGSEFTIRLPRSLKPADGPPAPLPEVATAGAVGSGARVLVVDDNDDAAEMLADLIRGQGCVVEVACDGPTALAVLERFDPALIILDIGLPGMDGFEVARRIRALPAHKATTLIALTGYGQRSDHERSRSAGFDQHLVKPVQFAQLLGALPTGTT
jgi:signal transduction histidine kinase